jgi:hypothetical protein
MKPEVEMQEEQPAASSDGVDITLIRWFLSLTPAERLRVVQQYANAVMRIRELNGRL